MKIEDVFNFRNAKSKGFEDYEEGDMPFVTNGFRNNGVQGYVKPKRGDRLFTHEGICISAFCEATVQSPPFLARGNGGSGLLVLEPKTSLTYAQLMEIAAYINSAHRWKFSYGRMVNWERVKHLEISYSRSPSPRVTLKSLLPKVERQKPVQQNPKFVSFNITELFDLLRGDFHAIDKLEEGKFATVSRVAYDNGIVGFYAKPRGANIYPKGTITVATTSGDAFVQTDEFISTDNVIILKPKRSFTLEDLFFIANMINRERWRVSYGRQCYKAIFSKTNIFLPVNKDGSLDHAYMKQIVSNGYNFGRVKQHITA